MGIEIEELCPKEDECGRNHSAQTKYLYRLQQLESGIPDEVLIDWFQQNPRTVSKWGFIDFQCISWAKKAFPLADVPKEEVFKGGLDQFNRVVCDVSLIRQWVYNKVKTDGTWSSPPVLLCTEDMQFQEDRPDWLREPIHLAEGYHRVAALHALTKEPSIKLEHEFWIGSPLSPVD